MLCGPQVADARTGSTQASECFALAGDSGTRTWTDVGAGSCPRCLTSWRSVITDLGLFGRKIMAASPGTAASESWP